MAICAELQPGFAGNVAVKGGDQPGYVLIPNSLSPDQCTSYVLLTRDEISGFSLFRLSAEDAGLVIGACALVWVAGNILGQILKFIGDSTDAKD